MNGHSKPNITLVKRESQKPNSISREFYTPFFNVIGYIIMRDAERVSIKHSLTKEQINDNKTKFLGRLYAIQCRSG